jgi:broad specificity phosphatase PhoE
MFLLRHGQSDVNLHFTATRRDPGIQDPRLTAEGRMQARAAAATLPNDRISRILVSPYTRALQTAAEITATLNVPVRISSAVRERFAFTCDVGSPRSRLEIEWPHDFSDLAEVWWPDRLEPEPAVIARAAQFRRLMRADTDAPQTLLISHWGFLLALTGRSLANGEWLEWDPMMAPPKEVVWQH